MPTESSSFVSSAGDYQLNLEKMDLVLRMSEDTLGSNFSEAKYHLTNQGGEKYDTTLVLGEDLIWEEDFAELIFPDVFVKGRYSLEVDPGGGKPKYFAFKGKSPEELMEGSV